MRVRFRCHHAQGARPDSGQKPRCVQCGETRIARVLQAPLPRLVGHGSGPLLESKALDAIPVALASKALKLKPRRDNERKGTHARPVWD